ncbi:MAG: flippase-like domain-containing protein [Prevotellaceae bacterium]|jgi:uncharacterized protein (TIRG00374 family)|nr:flippase-like domain-containing protein [Prevotellaceae bacterium]
MSANKETTIQSNDENKEIRKIKLNRILLPIFIGLAVVAYLFYSEFDPDASSKLHFTWKSTFWIFVAFLCILGRDIGYMIRIRVLSEGELSWRKAFRIIMLWEFTSAITPSAVGGTSVAIIYVNKEGISVGKSSAIVMFTSLLDEIYFVIMFPILIWVTGFDALFNISGSPTISTSIFTLCIIGYTIKFVWVLLLGYGLLFNPRGLSKLIQWVFKLPFLRRWKTGAAKAGNDIVMSSAEMKSKSWKFWGKAFLSTFLSWTSRYWIVNALLMAFFAAEIAGHHFMIFARQLIMWVTLLITPTPGGSGVAEVMFSQYLGEFIPIVGLAIAFAFLWRLVSYYPYLFIGAFIFPKWVQDKFGGKKKKQEELTIPENK